MLVPFYLAPPSVTAPTLTLTPGDIAAIEAAVLAALMSGKGASADDLFALAAQI